MIRFTSGNFPVKDPSSIYDSNNLLIVVTKH